MNTTDRQPQPARITRRTFVKRTGSTAIVSILALYAFRNEAFAAVGGSSEFPIQIASAPTGYQIGPVGGTETLPGGGRRIHSVSGTVIVSPANVNAQKNLENPKEGSIDYQISHTYTDDNGLTVTTSSFLDMQIDITVTNPQFPNQAAPVCTAEGGEQSWGNDQATLTGGASIEIKHLPMGIIIVIRALFAAVPSQADSYIINNTGNFEDETPPDLTLEHAEDAFVVWPTAGEAQEDQIVFVEKGQ